MHNRNLCCIYLPYALRSEWFGRYEKHKRSSHLLLLGNVIVIYSDHFPDNVCSYFCVVVLALD